MKKNLFISTTALISTFILASCGEVYPSKDKVDIDKNGNKILPNTDVVIPNDNNDQNNEKPNDILDTTLSVATLIKSFFSYDYSSGVQFNINTKINSVPNKDSDYAENTILTLPVNLDIKYNENELFNFNPLNSLNFSLNYEQPTMAADFSALFPAVLSMIPETSRLDSDYFAGFSLDYIGDGSLYYSIKADEKISDDNGNYIYKGDNDTLLTSKIDASNIMGLIKSNIPISALSLLSLSKLDLFNFNLSEIVEQIVSIFSSYSFSTITTQGAKVTLGDAGKYLINTIYKKAYEKILNTDFGNESLNQMMPGIIAQIIPQEINDIVLIFNEENGYTKNLNLKIMGNYFVNEDESEVEVAYPYTFLDLTLEKTDKVFDEDYFIKNSDNVLRLYYKTLTVQSFVDNFDLIISNYNERGEYYLSLDETKKVIKNLYSEFSSFDKYQKASVTGINNDYSSKFNEYYPSKINSLKLLEDSSSLKSGDKIKLVADVDNPYDLSLSFTSDSDLITITNTDKENEVILTVGDLTTLKQDEIVTIAVNLADDNALINVKSKITITLKA